MLQHHASFLFRFRQIAARTAPRDYFTPKQKRLSKDNGLEIRETSHQYRVAQKEDSSKVFSVAYIHAFARQQCQNVVSA